MSWCSDAPEDEAISLFAGLLANPDVSLSPQCKDKTEVSVFTTQFQCYVNHTHGVYPGKWMVGQTIDLINSLEINQNSSVSIVITDHLPFG
jgi:hypothetical protein